MGHSVRNVDDVLKDAQRILQDNPQAIFHTVLYRQSDEILSEFMKHHFIELNGRTDRNSHFFLLNHIPENWKDTQQWREFVFDDRERAKHLIQANDEEVQAAATYLKIPQDSLPCGYHI